MGKKFSKDRQQKEDLQPDYLEEAQRIERELDLMEDPWKDDDQIEEQMRLRIYRGILAEQQRRKKSVSWVKRVGKYTAMMVITLVAVFGVSMTSQANRQRFLRTITYMVGDKEAIEISNIDNIEVDASSDEGEIVMEIEEKLDCDYPTFMYKPKNFYIKSYSIYEDSGIALVRYSYEDTILTFYILKEDEDEVLGNLLHQGEIKDRFDMDMSDFVIEGTERRDKDDLKSTYVGHWIYKNSFYDISGKIEKKEFNKFLKNIRF
ncbi:MAG: DUF4367 domain-containing protein [Blautia sp.]